MARTSNSNVAPHVELLKGLNVKSREDGTVHTVHSASGKRTVAEVCVGKKFTRMNLRSAPTSNAPRGVKLDGRSKHWDGGGVRVTAENVKQCRALLEHIVGKNVTADDAVKESRKATTAKTQAVARATRKATPRKAASSSKK